MNARLVLACAISGLALTTFGATTAAAQTKPEISVQSDGELTPGAAVTIRAICPDEDFGNSVVASRVLTAEPFTRDPSAPLDAPMTSPGKINDNAAPGNYDVWFECGGEMIYGDFTVVDPPVPPTTEPTPEPTPPTQEPPQVSTKPKGAVDTGSLDPAPEQGSDAAVVALGGMVLLAAGGLGIAAYRRRQNT